MRTAVTTSGGSHQQKHVTYEDAPCCRCSATVYWEGEDEDGEGNGEFKPNEKGEADPAWVAYIVAER